MSIAAGDVYGGSEHASSRAVWSSTPSRVSETVYWKRRVLRYQPLQLEGRFYIIIQ